MPSTLAPVTPTATTLRATVSRARAAFHSGRTRAPEWRKTQLRALDRMLVQSEAELGEALRLDLGKSALEGYLTEIAFVRAEIAATLHELDRWLRPERV